MILRANGQKDLIGRHEIIKGQETGRVNGLHHHNQSKKNRLPEGKTFREMFLLFYARSATDFISNANNDELVEMK